MNKLTMVRVNGRVRFIWLPISPDGKVRIPRNMVRRGDCQI